MLNVKTQRLLDDYERMKAESEKMRIENSRLKDQVASQEKAKFTVLSHYDSKESLKKNQSLSVGDLIQLDSVQQLNDKLEEKNSSLEQQIFMMRHQMESLTEQTKAL